MKIHILCEMTKLGEPEYTVAELRSIPCIFIKAIMDSQPTQHPSNTVQLGNTGHCSSAGGCVKWPTYYTCLSAGNIVSDKFRAASDQLLHSLFHSGTW